MIIRSKRSGVAVVGALLGLLAAVLPFCPVMGADREPVLGRFRSTYYHVARESDYAHLIADDVILTLKGEILARVSTAFKRAVSVEGTGKLRDGRVINYAGRKNDEVRFRVTSNPYGDGVGTCALVPFRTVAVDPSKIPLGAVVRIEETIGMRLPDGSFHDGLWKAEDIGEAIWGNRIDLFVGEGDQGAVLTRHRITHLRPLTVRLVSPPPEDSCAKQTSKDRGPSP